MRKGRLGIPIGHGVSLIVGDAGAGKSTPDI
jgi:DNA repair exonuclease SbcCD ATPase subunit